MLAVVYKRLVGRFKKYGFENAGYFGGLKGLNDYRNLHAMAHVGLNRWRTQDYLLPWLAINNELYQDISKMDEKGSKEYLDQIWKGTSDISVLIDKYIAAHMVSDFEQNIFRLSIRNFSSTEPVNVWLFHYYEKNPVNTIAQNLIEEHFGQYAGVTFEHIDHLQELKDSRGKKLAEKHDTHAWRICKYLDEQAPVGKLFKVRDILRNTGLSDKQYQKAKAQNEWLAEKLARIGTDIKGLLYIRPP